MVFSLEIEASLFDLRSLRFVDFLGTKNQLQTAEEGSCLDAISQEFRKKKKHLRTEKKKTAKIHLPFKIKYSLMKPKIVRDLWD